jgi:glycosyltransferase involved in cell wall biosynthesis
VVASGEASPESPPLVLFVGARVPHKGVDVIRAAALEIWKTEPDARFAFVGPGAPLDEPDRRELDIGPVTDDERGRWLERATLLALPSSTESFGLVVAEAWSVRRPVVTSDIPVLRELVDRSHGGLAVPRDHQAIATAIRGLLRDPTRAEAMGRAGFKLWRDEYRPEAVARRHLEVYAALRDRPRASEGAPDPA